MRPAPASATDQGFTPLALKPGPLAAVKTAAGNGGTATAPGGHAAHASGGQNCATPKVTLQRQGEVVTGIRIQCSCGQVIELRCVY
ncbi:MAG: hypothetical protein ABSG04_03670 [Verrucomicrobiota bacterium]|jgi:hypothetical protein